MAKDFITLFRMVCGLELRNSFWNFPFMFWATLDRGLLKVKKDLYSKQQSHARKGVADRLRVEMRMGGTQGRNQG